MKFFKPFTPPYDKKTIRADYRYDKMFKYARRIKKGISLKEKYWRMDASFYDICSEKQLNKMLAMEEESENCCMYCNRKCKQIWTHEDSWVIHLCISCLILDKITILLERIIKWFEDINDKMWPKTDIWWFNSFTYS